MSEKKQWETRDLTGSAFVNKRKQKDSHPDFTGEALILTPGLYWMNIWEKRRGNGEPWYSVSFSPKEDRNATSSVQVNVKAEKTATDDEIPF